MAREILADYIHYVIMTFKFKFEDGFILLAAGLIHWLSSALDALDHRLELIIKLIGALGLLGYTIIRVLLKYEEYRKNKLLNDTIRIENEHKEALNKIQIEQQKEEL